MSVTSILDARPILRADDEPTQDEVLASARRLAAARMAVRDLPKWRPSRSERFAIAKIDRAHSSVLEARAELRRGSGGYEAKKRLARAQLAEMLVARRAGFASYDEYRRACRPRTSFTASAYRRLHTYRELATAEAAWGRVRRALVGDVVIDLRDKRALLAAGY